MHAPQHGIALLTALIIVALVTSAAVAMAARQLVEIRRTGNLLDYDRAVELIGDLETEARAVFELDGELSRTDTLSEPWATEELRVSTAAARASAGLFDLQARFNINNLVLLPGAGLAPRSDAARGPAPPGLEALPARDGGGGGAPAPGDAPVRARAQPPGPGGDGADDARADRGRDPSARAGPAQAPQPIDPAQWEIPEFLLDDEFERGRQARNRILLRELARRYGWPVPGSSAGDNADAAAGRGTNAGAQHGAVAGATSPERAGTNTRTPAEGEAVDAGAGSAGSAPAAGDEVDPRRILQIARLRFVLLLQALDLDPGLAQAVLDWMDPDSDTRFPNGAEDAYYMQQDPPYRAANAALASTRELLLVRGITEDVYARLAPFITALPVRTGVNVNTAPRELLMSLGPMLDAATADGLVSAREVQPYASTTAFVGHPLLAGRPIPVDELTVASRWFELRALAHGDRLEIAARSVITRPQATRAMIVRRSTGYYDEH